MWVPWRSPEGRAAGRTLAAGALALAAMATWPAHVAAEGIPPAFKAMVLQPSGLPERHEFDLTEPLKRAQKEGKRLYVYLGAHDCPYCRRYEAFLAGHVDELLQHFAPYLIVDLRSALMAQSSQLSFRIGEHRWSYTEFQRSIGDERARQLVYPNVWLLDAQARPLMQMPGGAGTFETVPEQIEILNLVN
jgi:thioredoxin-related protein